MVLAFKDGKQNYISIPYGAIKSSRYFIVIYQRRCISIPYGAIKRMQEPLLLFDYIHFNSLWCD